MMADLKYIAFLAVLWLIFKFGPVQLVNRIIMAFLGKSGLEDVGRKALAEQPDRITLKAAPGPVKPEALTAVSSLERRGFERAGSFDVLEMKGVKLHLLVKPPESVVGVVYEHPKAGVWADVSSRYADGTSFTITSARAGHGLEKQPGHVSVAAPGQPTAMLALRLVRERPAGALRQITAAEFPGVFQQAYADSMAWRKGKGLSAEEVRRSGLERVSA
jgi:hypothetical protein